jgi:hypothetical protein
MDRDKRPSLPSELKRQVLVESGHRCAIPTCRNTPVEIAHIISWESCKEHEFNNLIALCPTCHTRFGSGTIDRKSMFMYKHNLGVINSRYCDFEQRVLQGFAKDQKTDCVLLPGGLDIMLSYVIQDGLVKEYKSSLVLICGIPSHKEYAITAKGRTFIGKWMGVEDID